MKYSINYKLNNLEELQLFIYFYLSIIIINKYREQYLHHLYTILINKSFGNMFLLKLKKLQ